MILTVCSSKGSPGVTSAALVLAAAWPRQVVLVEADTSAGDLAYRCISDAGGPLAESPSLLGLAAAARSNRPNVLNDFAQKLACGASIVQGVSSPAQARGLTNLWPAIAGALRAPEVDVIIDVGRFAIGDSSMPLVAAADRVLVAHTSSMESVMHTRESLLEYSSANDSFAEGGRLVPLMIGPARHMAADRTDVDAVFAAAGLTLSPTMHLPLDRPALDRLERGERADGRLSRTMLLRAAVALANELIATSTEGVAA